MLSDSFYFFFSQENTSVTPFSHFPDQFVLSLINVGEQRLYHVLPSYRSPTAILINELFLLETKEKETILRDLQIGFFAD